MVINSKVYIPKLTEQREILNILKSGNVDLMNPLFDSLRVLFKIYLSNSNGYSGDEVMKSFYKEVKFFYSYKTKSFSAKIFIDDDRYIKYLDYENEINYKSEFVSKNITYYANIGEDILLLGKKDTKKLHKIFFDPEVNKENKKEEVLNFLTDKLSQDVLKETSKLDVDVKKVEREFKKLFKNYKISLECAQSDPHWNDFIVTMFKKEIYSDLECGCGYLFFDNPEFLNHYKIGAISSLMKNKEFVETIFKESVLFSNYSKKQGCYLSNGYKPLMVLMGLLLLSSTITSISKKRKFELISELIPEEGVVFSGNECDGSLFYYIDYSCGESFNNFMISGAKTFISEVINLLYYLIDKDVNKAKNLVNFVEKILEENFILEDLLVVGCPGLLADFFLLKEKIKNKQKNKRFSGDLLYQYTIVRYNMMTEDVILNLKKVFNSKGIKIGFVFNKDLSNTASDYNDLVYISKVSKTIEQPIVINFYDETDDNGVQDKYNFIDNLSRNVHLLKESLTIESDQRLSLKFNFNRSGTITLKNELEILLNNNDQLYSILHILRGFCDFDIETWQLKGLFKVRKTKTKDFDKTRYFSQVES